MPRPMRHFRFWCQSVLPLVYDDSLSYYEVLCKVVKYINDLIDQDKEFAEDIEELKKELEEVQQWIDNFDTSYAEKIISEYIATMIFVGLTDDGHFIIYIPDEWDEISFSTSGYDDFTPLAPDYGHLILSY